MSDETSGIIGWPIGQQYRDMAARNEASSTTTWETIVQNYKTRAVRDGARIDELRQSTEHWHDTAQMLKRQRNVAEEERDSWKERALKAEQWRQVDRDLITIAEGQRDQAKQQAEAIGDNWQRTYDHDCKKLIAEADHWKGEWAVVMGQLGGARAECEALRKRLDEWVRWGDRTASGHPDAPMASLDHEVRAVIANRYGMSVIDATMGVQSTKYRLPFIAHEKCHDFNSCARHQKCMYGKIGASGKWDNCFTAGEANE